MTDILPVIEPLFHTLPPEVTILVVVDGLNFSDVDDNGLGICLDTLTRARPAYVRLRVRRARRDGPHVRDPRDGGIEPNFRFSADALEGVDELWLFGLQGEGSALALSADEVRSVTEFMNRGGGVFATGDHEDLGFAMCGAIPRVRTMRRWARNETPTQFGRERHDTLVPAVTGAVNQPVCEPDDRPQRIAPTTYRDIVGTHPHPLLCGERGTIEDFPDHIHEGVCAVPRPLPADEYPGGVGPVIVARGTVTRRSQSSAADFPTPRTFDLVCAYDGHRASAGLPLDGPSPGRVATDSTWHHFVNLNLRGLRSAALAPGATPEHVKTWSGITSYYANLAVWLAPIGRQRGMMAAALVQARFMYPVTEEVVAGAEELRDMGVIRAGRSARTALGRLAPQCQVGAWAEEALMDPILRDRVAVLPFPEEFLEFATPWHRSIEESPEKDDAKVDVAGGLRTNVVADAVLGGIMLSVVERFPDTTLEPKDVELGDIVGKGIRIGLEAAAEVLEQSSDRLGELAKGLRGMLG